MVGADTLTMAAFIEVMVHRIIWTTEFALSVLV